MTVADIIKKLQDLPQHFEVAVETQEGVSEVYDFETDNDRTYKLSVDYSGDYHELRELDNHEVGLANRVPGIIVLKSVDD